MNDSSTNIKDISQLIIQDDNFISLSKDLDIYCPFESLSVARQEIRHSNFLADILNPIKPHGFQDEILRKFCILLLQSADEDIAALKLSLLDSISVDIRREWQNIDLIIRFPKFNKKRDLIFVIEIKVEASESKDQLKKYENIVSATWPKHDYLYFFLNPDGDDASDPKWKAVSFELLLEALDRNNAATNGNEAAEMMVKSYTKMLKGRYMQDKDLEDLAIEIWSKHKQTLNFLMDRRPTLLEPVTNHIKSQAFFDDINKSFKDKNLDIEISLDSPDSKASSIIRLAVKKWDMYPDFLKAEGWTNSNRLVLIEFGFSERKIRGSFVLGRGEKEARDKIFNGFLKSDILKKATEKKPSKEYKRLYSKTFESKDSLEKFLDEIEQKDINAIIKKIKDYIIENTPIFDKSIRQNLS